MDQQRALRGLTLIETLIVIAIAALLIAVLVVWLWPSDERRCQMEAERLANYLRVAAAEAVMSDSPTRVAFDLTAQHAEHQRFQQGAELVDEPWTKDESAETFEPRYRVKLDTLITLGGSQREGEGYVPFVRGQTPPAVVILTLGEAAWSVVVPGTDADIRVERGRAPLPAGRKSSQRPGLPGVPSFAAELTTDLGWTPMAQGTEPTTPTASTSPTVTADPDPSNPDPTPDLGQPPEDPVDAQTPPRPVDASVPEPDEDDPEPDAAVEEPECRQDTDCTGPWRRCVEQHCIIDPSGKAFRLRRAQVLQPEIARTTLSTILNNRIAQGQLNLVTQFIDSSSAFVIQATPAGEAYGLQAFRPATALPSYLTMATPTSECSAGLTLCYELRTEQELMSIYLPRQGNLRPGECEYQKLSVKVELHLGIHVGEIASDISALITIRGAIPESGARALIVDQRTRQSLAQLFEQEGVEPVVDTNDDGQADGWPFVLQGEAYEVSVVGSPYNQRGVQPCEP